MLHDRNASYSCLSQLAPLEESTGQTPEQDLPRRSSSYSKLRHVAGLDYQSKNLDVPIVVVASEVEPFSKSGGLAIVGGAYGYEFAMGGHRTMVVSPMYDDYPGAVWLADKEVAFFGARHKIQYFHLRKVHDAANNLATDYVFVHLECFRRPGGLYHDKNGEYTDNLFRFGLFSLAALEAPLCCTIEGSTYGEKVMFIANDWQAGLVPVMLAHKFRPNGTYNTARSIFVIHNMGYQGVYPWKGDELRNLDLPESARNDIFFIFPEYMRCSAHDRGECTNLTKGGIICSDRVLTVSANYAWEITTPEGGFLLDGLCRSKGIYLAGIQNGIEDSWDPATDKKIAARYTADDVSGKAACKTHLQQSLGLNEDPTVALLGFVGRLTPQKGLDVLRDGVVDWLLRDEGNGITGRVQIILMGNGDQDYSDWLRDIEKQYKGRVCGYAGFKPSIERDMMAGCDFLLMPSRYEPCGIPQMVALAYGTIPVVHATGGLKDSVVDARSYDPKERQQANGYLVLPLTPDKLKETLWVALETFHKNQPEHLRLMKNGMACDFYWPKAIGLYEKHIDYTMGDPPLYKKL